MTVEQLRAAYERQPFRPFIIHLANGREYSVPSREFMYVPPNSRTFAVYQPDEAIHLIDLLLVAELEFRPMGNGTRKRK
jgi:hypothetical protein